jgi:hypothetical protein
MHYTAVLRIRIGSRMFLGFSDLDLLVRGTDPLVRYTALDPSPDSSIIKQK